MSESSVGRDGPASGTNVNVALAVARQRLGDAHFRFVLEVIRRGQGDVAAPQALTIYARLHHLNEADQRALRNRVLVYLGQIANTEVTHLPHTFVAIDGDVEWDITASLVQRIRKRLSGRRNHTFREWIEIHGGHVESKLTRVHVENVVGVLDASPPETRLRDVVQVYLRELGLREALFEPLYNGLLERLYESFDAASAEPRAASRDGAGEERAASESGGKGRRAGGSASVA